MLCRPCAFACASLTALKDRQQSSRPAVKSIIGPEVHQPLPARSLSLASVSRLLRMSFFSLLACEIVRGVNGPMLIKLAEQIEYHDKECVELLRTGGKLSGVLKRSASSRLCCVLLALPAHLDIC